jgi:hypothetical protein
LCDVAAEGTHVLGDEAPTEWADDVGEVAEWMAAHAESETGRRVLAGGFGIEHGVLRDDTGELERLVGLDDGSDPPGYAATGGRILAWHRMVGSCALHRIGRADLALPMLDAAVADLEQISDEHRHARALRERA